MYRIIKTDSALAVTIHIDGQPVSAREGEPVAAVFHRLGGALRHHPLSGAPRIAYCMMGVCFDCLVSLADGTTAQACLLPATEGLHITRQSGIRSCNDV